MLPGGDANAGGGAKGETQAGGCRATTALAVVCPTFDGGSTFDGCAIDPVTSGDGGRTTTCWELERGVQPDKIRQTETIADKANERM